MYAPERQQQIAQLTSARGRVAVTDLARHFSVTPETIRRDLAELDRLGVVSRVHGGAIPRSSLPRLETTVAERSQRHAGQKAAIARAALSWLPAVTPSGRANVILDAGTTTAALAELIPPREDLTCVTNSVPIAGQLVDLLPGEVVLLGGRVRGMTQATVGETGVETLGRLRVDVTFLGTDGVTIAHGASTPDSSEAATKRAMAAAGRVVVLLADSSKIGAEHLVQFARLEDIDVLITDDGLAPADRKALSDKGVEVVIA
ncbi:DeoR/GlpR family DNA-binding transcription regulator [Actinomycetota bacterium]